MKLDAVPGPFDEASSRSRKGESRREFICQQLKGRSWIGVDTQGATRLLSRKEWNRTAASAMVCG